jgi:hypothetical protein
MSESVMLYGYAVVAVVLFFILATLDQLEELSGVWHEEGGLFFCFVFAVLWPLGLLIGFIALGVWLIALPPRLLAKAIHKQTVKRGMI